MHNENSFSVLLLYSSTGQQRTHSARLPSGSIPKNFMHSDQQGSNILLSSSFTNPSFKFRSKFNMCIFFTLNRFLKLCFIVLMSLQSRRSLIFHKLLFLLLQRTPIKNHRLSDLRRQQGITLTLNRPRLATRERIMVTQQISIMMRSLLTTSLRCMPLTNTTWMPMMAMLTVLMMHSMTLLALNIFSMTLSRLSRGATSSSGGGGCFGLRMA
mmetsp:Transcript_36221/g.41249  ORF Transcript_36221/g.41249 Transcript_36221/m.41249 type:complete len:212 (-) Transcript_36221:634-1269(-)